MQLLLDHFPDLTEQQIERFSRLQPLYAEWNARINVISRKDIDNLYERHVLHSLSIAKVVAFQPNRDILDIGTGGGFPGIPLAILFPETNFLLVDSIGKKMTVVKAIAGALELTNVTAEVVRAETLTEQRFDFVITRAVAPLDKLYEWTYGKIKRHSKHPIHNGILALKGGDISEEKKPFGDKVTLYPIHNFFQEEYFHEKYVVHLPI